MAARMAMRIWRGIDIEIDSETEMREIGLQKTTPLDRRVKRGSFIEWGDSVFMKN